MHRQYFVYILASKSRRLYTGITNNIERRIFEHRLGKFGFTSRYHINRLVHCEVFPTAYDAITREKCIKTWRRERKLGLISAANPTWDDLLPSANADPSLRSG